MVCVNILSILDLVLWVVNNLARRELLGMEDAVVMSIASGVSWSSLISGHAGGG